MAEGIMRTYHGLPVLLQHAVVSARGWHLRRLRYANHTRKTFEFLMGSQFWTSSELQDYQDRKVQEFVNHCYANVPYYHALFRENRLYPSDIRRAGDLPKIPVLTKEGFRRNSERLLATNWDRKRMWIANTSGTTGTPLAAHFIPKNVQERTAFYLRLFHWYTKKEWPRRASFTGQLVVNPDCSSASFFRANWPIHQRLYSSHHLNASNYAAYVETLRRYNPDQIDGIASAIYVIADYLVRSSARGTVQPNVVIPTSETLWPHLRERIEQGFGCPVANQYSSQEGAPFAYECPSGGFHICPESGVFEILRADGTPARPGEVGVLVVTSFLTEGMPLVRYSIGDLAKWAEGVCSCGRQMPLLEDVVGRIDDMFFTEERGVVPRVDAAFKGMPSSIVAAQVAQVGHERFELRLVPDRSQYTAADGVAIAEHLHDYLGRRVRIDVMLVTEIARTQGGKTKVMVNEWDEGKRNHVVNQWNIENPR